MATDLPSCFAIQFLEQLLKFLLNFALLKKGNFQRSYDFLITKELTFWLPNFFFFHFSSSLSIFDSYCYDLPLCDITLALNPYL